MGTTADGREVHLIRRPTGWPEAGDFQLVARSVAAAPGEVVVRNRFLSVDPYMRGRMSDAKSYAPPFELGQPLIGGAVGVVLAGTAGELEEGDVVAHTMGWREYAVGPARAFRRIQPLPGVSLSAYLGALGMPGLTAYVGLLDISNFRAGESVFISAAAGAVGGMVGQIARLRDAGRVIGSAGSDQKVAHLIRDLGFDAAFNYHQGEPASLLEQAARGGGIDVYFDNVGGAQLEAALSALNPHGRVALCGAISQYNSVTPSPGPRNLALAVGKRLRLQGFLIGDHQDRHPAFLEEVGGAVLRGEIKVDETVVVGIDRMVEAFVGMMRGENVGKMVIQVAD